MIPKIPEYSEEERIHELIEEDRAEELENYIL